MLTIEEVKKEYFRIEKLLGKEAVNMSEYAANCKKGYSIRFIGKDLGLSFNGMKKIIGAKAATCANNKGGTGMPGNKIECLRGGRHIIFANNCVPGCNDACISCKNKQAKNVQAINTTTPEEDRELSYTSSFGNSGALAASEGLYSN